MARTFPRNDFSFYSIALELGLSLVMLQFLFLQEHNALHILTDLTFHVFTLLSSWIVLPSLGDEGCIVNHTMPLT